MAFVGRLWRLALSAESWIIVNGPAISTWDDLVWEDNVGREGDGGFRAREFGNNQIGDGYFEWSGTWEDLGLRPGSIIKQITANITSFDFRTEQTGTATIINGPLELRDGAGILRAELIPDLWTSDQDWTTRQMPSSVSIANDPSTTPIKIRQNLIGFTGSGGFGNAAQAWHDNFQIGVFAVMEIPVAKEFNLIRRSQFLTEKPTKFDAAKESDFSSDRNGILSTRRGTDR